MLVLPRLLLGATVLVFVALSESAFAVTIDWVSIGDPGNAPYFETSFGWTAGAVDHPYQISKYEVTNAQYAEFLSAKAAVDDPLALYNTGMGSGYGGITRSGNSGSYTYSAIAGRENMPVNFVSYYDSLRFANWLNNGQGSGDTETGAYTLLGGTPVPSNGTTVWRNVGATILLPSEDEWLKAGYYDPGLGFWHDLPFANAPPNASPFCEAPPGTTSSSANCSLVGDVTDVGSYTVSRSAYGTFDQGGNVWEWSDLTTSFGPSTRGGLHGGSFRGNSFLYIAQSYDDKDREVDDQGFRVASIPEPATGLLVMAGMLGLAGCCKRSRCQPRRGMRWSRCSR
jgi:formylglycine-generating enzyme required for sulfatase activity